MTKKAYKYKLNPTFKQKNLLSQFFGCARFIYNWGLNRKESFYKETKENLSYVMLTKELTALKKQEETKWLNECANVCLQQSLRNLEKAYSNFFHKKAERPKLKSKKKSKDVCKFIDAVRFDFNKWIVWIPKVGWTKLCLNRTFDTDKCKIGTLTVSRDRCGTYWCSIVVEDHEQPKPKAKVSESTSVGIDLGIKTYATLSDGTKYSNPKHYERALKLLAVRQRKFARTQKDSKRHEAMRLKVARLMRRIANQRQDYLHKMSAELVKKHDTIFLEDLNVQDMQKDKNISMHIQSASWYEFARQLSYKSEWSGKNVVFIGRYEPSSQTCSECGYRNEETKDLGVRKWVCPKCGAVHDRDVNAARNILRFGMKKAEAS